MPRRAIEPSPEIAPLIDKIQRYLDAEKIKLNRFCKQARIGQSSLCRFMSGERKTVTSAAKAAEVFIDSRHKQHNSGRRGTLRAAEPGGDQGLGIIDEAIQAHWDGSQRSAALIALLIKAVAPVIEAAGKY